MTVRYVPGAVSTLTLARSERRNAIDLATASAIAEACAAFAADPEALVLVVTGEGGAFCAGADLTQAPALASEDRGPNGPLGFSALDPGKPTIAAIEGPCVAGGMELAAWCDIRIAADDAYFGAFNRRWGVPFVDGGTWRFPAIVGLGNALYLVETGARLSAEQAQRIGFVQEIVASGTALARALELAEAMTTYPQGSIRTDRQATIDAVGRPRLDALAREQEVGAPSLRDPDLAAGLGRFTGGQRPSPPAAR